MRLFAAALLFAIACLSTPAFAEDCVTNAAAATQPEGAVRPLSCDLTRNLRVTTQGGAAAGGAASGNPDQVAGIDASGNVRRIATTTAGALVPPLAGTAQRVITKTAVGATTSTQVCPAVTNPVSVEVQVSVVGGLGLQGESLTSATYGTGAGSPDLVIAAAGTVYTFPFPPTNAITFYSGSAGTAICVQTVRQ